MSKTRQITSREPRIFLSYAKEDSKRVKAVYRRLLLERLNPWLDLSDLLPGQNWDIVILKEIKNARFVIVFLSANSINKRGYVQKEIKHALEAAERMPEGEIFLIPVRLENCDVPDSLTKWHWIDIFRPYGFKKVANTLKLQLGLDEIKARKLKIIATLDVIEELGQRSRIELLKLDNLIGRNDPHSRIFPDVDLEKYDPERTVSRRHARIKLKGKTFLISDLGSTNGTFIIRRGKIFRVIKEKPRVLKNTDMLRLGALNLGFLYGPSFAAQLNPKALKRPSPKSKI